MSFDTPNPKFRERVIDGFGSQRMMKTLGISLDSVDPGRVVLKFGFHEDLTQQDGVLHAGAVSTALDSACGFSAYTLIPEDASILTIENKLNLLRPGTEGPFRVLGEVIKAGRSVIVSEGQVLDDRGKLIATMSASNLVMYKEKM